MINIQLLDEAVKKTNFSRNTKCPFCEFRTKDRSEMYEHIELKHPNHVPKDYSPARVFYNATKGIEHGKCRICGRPTEWSEATLRYNVFCDDPKCKEEYRDIFKRRMIDKYGKVHLLDDPNMQKKMLQGRKISGSHEFIDGGKVDYVGSYEKDWLEFCDTLLELKSDEIMSPCPFLFGYTLDKETKKLILFSYKEYEEMNETDKELIHSKYLLYMPDFYIPSLNLIVEIKHGGDNPNMHPKIQEVDIAKDKAKLDVMMKQKRFNFIKIEDKKYGKFLTYFYNVKFYEEKSKESGAPIVLTESYIDSMEYIENNKIEIMYSDCDLFNKDYYLLNVNNESYIYDEDTFKKVDKDSIENIFKESAVNDIDMLSYYTNNNTDEIIKIIESDTNAMYTIKELLRQDYDITEDLTFKELCTIVGDIKSPIASLNESTNDMDIFDKVNNTIKLLMEE